MIKYFLNKEGTRYINSILYKYCSINENLYSLLINNELWFSDPMTFNDPYDCNLHYDWSNIDYDTIYNHLKEINERKSFDVGNEYLVKRAKQIFDNVDERDQLGENIIGDLVRRQGISCFSEADNILLMWSHYSDKHSGVCLTFDMEKDNELFTNPYKVDYPERYPKFNPFSSSKEIQLILATKSKDWLYEKEVRVIKEGRRGTFKFRPETITEIKFGYKTSDDDIKTVKNLVSRIGMNIKFFKASIKTLDFGLEFYPV
jgi:hypothetical protein